MVLQTNEIMISKIEQEVVTAYQNETQLKMFLGKDISDIGIVEWYHKNLNDIPAASLIKASAGFSPQKATLDADLFHNTVLIASEYMEISEVEWAQFKRHGIDADGIAMLGKKVALAANLYLWLGQDSAGDQPVIQYNFIKDPGTGNGTLARPLMETTASVAAWSTWANKAKDLSRLVSNLQIHDYNLATTTVFYPMAAAYLMNLRGSATNEVSALDYLHKSGVKTQVVGNQFMYTLAGATPTADLFDLYAIDQSQIKIGYTRPERSRVIPPHDEVRYHRPEAEVWFTPYIIPRPWAENGKIYKGVARITAIASA